MSRSPGRLALERRGTGEPLVLLHGIGASRRVWDPVVPLLEQQHEVIGLDLPGFGQSPLPAGVVPSAPALADAVERELELLGVHLPHLVGNSMGGQVALELAARGRARGVVALAPTGGWTRREARYARLAVTALRLGARVIRPLAGPLMRPAFARRAALWLTNSRGHELDPAAAAAGVWELARQPGFPAARDWFTSHRAQGLERIACPVTLAWGAKDRLLPRRQATRLAALIPTARLVELPGAGHVPMIDDPDAVATVILEATSGAQAVSE